MNKERRKEIPVGTRPGQTGLWKSELHALLRLSPVCMPTFDQWGIDQQEEEDLCWKEDDQCWSSPKTTAAEIKGKCLRYMFITAESKEKEGSNEVRNDHQEGRKASDDRFAAHRLPTRERERALSRSSLTGNMSSRTTRIILKPVHKIRGEIINPRACWLCWFKPFIIFRGQVLDVYNLAPECPERHQVNWKPTGSIKLDAVNFCTITCACDIQGPVVLYSPQ